MINSEGNWVGNLSINQLYGLLFGYSSLETKKTEALKSNVPQVTERSIKGGAIRKGQVASIRELKAFPGVKKIKKSR